MAMRMLAAAALWAAGWPVAGQPLFTGVEDPVWPGVWQPGLNAGIPGRTDLPAAECRVAPPDPQQEAEARERIQRLLDGRIASGREFEELRRLALETNDDRAARYVLTRMAIEAGIDAGESAAAIRLADRLATEFAVEGPELRTEVVCRALAVEAAGSTVDAGLMDIVRETIERLLLDDRPELAKMVVAGAVDAGDLCESGELAAWSVAIGEWETGLARAQRAALRLVQSPGDPEASLAVGRYLCFFKDQWERGLPMLAVGPDESLRRVALDELQQGVAGRIRAAEAWGALGEASDGLLGWRLGRHADSLLREAYPLAGGLQRLEIEAKLQSRPLFCFGPKTEADESWQRETLRFWANHGHEGPGRWAMLSDTRAGPELVANRAGYVATLEHFPPEGVDRYVIEASLASDLLPGTALEFCGQRMYTTGEGIVMENGWRPEREHTLGTGFHSFRIEGSPGEISFMLDGLDLGTMPVSEPGRGPLVLRGWEGHVRCRRLEMWSVPDDSVAGYVRGRGAVATLD